MSVPRVIVLGPPAVGKHTVVSSSECGKPSADPRMLVYVSSSSSSYVFLFCFFQAKKLSADLRAVHVTEDSLLQYRSELSVHAEQVHLLFPDVCI